MYNFIYKREGKVLLLKKVLYNSRPNPNLVAATKQKNNYSWYAILIVVFLLWGTFHPAIKVLSGDVEPFLLNFLRFLIVAIVLAPFALKNRIKVEKNDLIGISILGFIGIVLVGVIDVIGVSMSTALDNAILFNSWPLMVIILAPILLKETVSRRAMLGTLLGFIGIIIVVTNGEGLSEFMGSGNISGDLLILLAALCFGINAMYSKRYIEKYGGLQVTFYAVVAATFFLFIGTLASGQLGGALELSTQSIILILWIAVVTTALCRVVWFDSIAKIGLVETSAFFLIIPISGIITAHFFLNDPITLYTVVGTILILVGVYIVQVHRNHKVCEPHH